MRRNFVPPRINYEAFAAAVANAADIRAGKINTLNQVE